MTLIPAFSVHESLLELNEVKDSRVVGALRPFGKLRAGVAQDDMPYLIVFIRLGLFIRSWIPAFAGHESLLELNAVKDSRVVGALRPFGKLRAGVAQGDPSTGSG